MPESLIEQLPKIVAEGKKEAERILEQLSSSSRITLQTNEYVLPSKEQSGLFRGTVAKDITQEWFNRLIYGDNLLVMQALLGGDPATGLPVLTSRELSLDPFMERAGQRLALRNVFGEQATGVGPLSGYLQRQLSPLTSAFRGGAWEDMARGFAGDRDLALAGLGGTAEGPTQFDYGLPSMGGDAGSAVELPGTGLQAALAGQAATGVGGDGVQAAGVAGMPGYSFEDYLRTTRDQPTGLGGAYGQALQNVGYLRGLGQGAVPPALAGILNPEQAAGTRDARSLLGAAQKGRYSGLVSRAFRRPSEEDLFADYVLARQDATTAGQIPQNFLGFAASRYGL